MYSLLSFRLGVVDQRVPLTAGALMAAFGAVSSLPATSQVTLLLVIPVGIVWLMRLTATHNRSKEDVLRRIDEIERQINVLAGEELLTFQSRHPNRVEAVSGGRTGAGAAWSVLSLCVAGLLGCLALAIQGPFIHGAALALYLVYLFITFSDLVHVAIRLRRYRYEKSVAGHPPVGFVFRQQNNLR